MPDHLRGPTSTTCVCATTRCSNPPARPCSSCGSLRFERPPLASAALAALCRRARRNKTGVWCADPEHASSQNNRRVRLETVAHPQTPPLPLPLPVSGGPPPPPSFPRFAAGGGADKRNPPRPGRGGRARAASTTTQTRRVRFFLVRCAAACSQFACMRRERRSRGSARASTSARKNTRGVWRVGLARAAYACTHVAVAAPRLNCAFVVGQSEDAAWPRGRPRRHSIPQSVPLFLAHGSGLLPCTRALSEYAGASHTQVCGCARARVFPITCNFVGLVKRSGTEWGTVGREKKNTTRKNNYLSPSDVQSPVSYLPTYTRCFIFFSSFSLSACPSVPSEWRSAKGTFQGAHIGSSPNEVLGAPLERDQQDPARSKDDAPGPSRDDAWLQQGDEQVPRPPCMARHLPVQRSSGAGCGPQLAHRSLDGFRRARGGPAASLGLATSAWFRCFCSPLGRHAAYAVLPKRRLARVIRIRRRSCRLACVIRTTRMYSRRYSSFMPRCAFVDQLATPRVQLTSRP